MPQIQIPEISAKLRRVFQIKGPGEIGTMAPEIVPVTVVEDITSPAYAAENLADKDVYLWAANRAESPVAAQRSKVQVALPDVAASEGWKSVVMRASCRATGACYIVLRISNSELLNPLYAYRTDLSRYNLLSTPNATARTATLSQTAAGPALGAVIAQIRSAGNNTLDLLSFCAGPIVLTRDSYLVVESDTDNVGVNVNFSGYELRTIVP